MFVYYAMYVVVGFGVFVVHNTRASKLNRQKAVCILGFALFTLLLALRHQSMGSDLAYHEDIGYLGSFDYLSSISWREVLTLEKFKNYERGFIILNKAIGTISRDRQWYLAAMAMLSVLPVSYVVYKKSESPLFSFLVFMGLPVVQMYFSGMRQICAIALCTAAMLFIEDKKPVKFLITVFLATLFHHSAWIFLIAYPLFHLKMNSQLRLFSIMLFPIVYIFRTPLFAILSRLFKDDAEPDNNGAVMLMLLFFAIYIFCCFFTDGSRNQNGYMNLFYFAALCQIFSGIYSTAMRAGYYFSIAAIFAVPSVIERMKERDKKIVAVIVGIGFILFSLRLLSNTESFAQSNPYYFFWQK